MRTAAPVATAATPLAKDAAPASAEPVIAPIAAVPAAPAIVAEPQAIETPTPLAADDSGGDALAIAAILAGLAGIGAAGAMAARRRRRLITADEPAYEPVAATVPVDIRPAATSPATVREYAIAGTAGERATGWAVAQGNVAMPFAVPEGPVPSGTAREHLIERMVAARPDAANPFKSTVARRKRARIILQARAHRQRQAATAPFDFRTYKDIEAEGAELAATPHIAGA